MLPVQSIISLLEPSQQEGAEVDRPHPVCHLLQADVLFRQDMTHVHPALVPANPAVGTDVAGLEMLGILRRVQRTRIGARRGPVVLCGRPLPQGFMRPLLVVLLPKGVEAPLGAWPRP